jgi:ubiquitin carboxyl-terminal hydrolase 48
MLCEPAVSLDDSADVQANAFLQVWYRNIVFRNGVYKAAQTAVSLHGHLDAPSSRQKPNTPIYHLAIVFASLQFSERAVVDPSPLIDSLGLKKGDQQDAAE